MFYLICDFLGLYSVTAFTRQTSSTHRQKKKATGFKIGYGRDYRINKNDDDDGHGTGSRIGYGRDDRINNNSVGHDVNHHVQPSLHTSTTTTSMVSFVSDSDSQSHQGQAQQQQQQQQSIDDAESRFEQIKARIADKLSRAHELAASVSAARKDSIRRRRKAADDLHLATIRLGELEKQLEDACEAEDFEAADRINESLAAADKDKQALLTALRDAEAQCNAIDSKMLKVLNCQIVVEECATLLHHFSEDAMSNADLVFKKLEAQSSEETEKWLSSTEALELNKIESQIEAHLVDDARVVFYTSLDGLIKDDKREKEFLCNRKDILTDELQKLLALVKEKEKEIAENESKIKQVDQRIADTVSGFQEMQSSIDSKYDSLQSHLSHMEIESETLSKKKEEIDKLVAEEEHRGIKLKELAEISIGEAKMYEEVVGLRKSLLSSVLKSMEDKVRLAKTEEKLSEDVQILQLEASMARASLQEIEGLILSKEKELAMARFQRLILIAGAAKAERSAALVFGDEEEANLLLAVANAANSEAKELQPKYNLKEEEFEDLPKHFISLELVTSLNRTTLADLATLSGA